MPRDQRDYFYWQAKKAGLRSRAAYKLFQVNEKFNVIRHGDTVVDLGAAPGGWLQAAKELSGGRIIGVDLQSLSPIPGVTTIIGDITKEETIDRILEKSGGKVDVVICDASPDLSGSWSLDHARSIDLAASALRIAQKALKPGGNFVVKVFQGDMFKDFLIEVKRYFKRAQATSPGASRRQSAEMYIIGKKYLEGE